MSKRNRTLIIIYSALGVLILSLIALTQSGCASNPQLRPTNASQMMYGSLKGAHGHMDSAIYDAQQAKKLIGKGQSIEFIDANIHECEAGKSEILVGMAANDKVNDEARAAHARAEMLERDIRDIKRSWPYRIGRFLVWGAVLIIAWIFVVWTFPIFALLLPGWAGTLIGGIGRIANPSGWGQWYAEKKRINTALFTQPPGN